MRSVIAGIFGFSLAMVVQTLQLSSVLESVDRAGFGICVKAAT